MLDNHHRVAVVAQAMQHAQKLLDVMEVQTGSGFVENVEGFPRVALGELPRELYALRLAAGQGGGALPQSYVGKSHIHERAQLPRQDRHGAEEIVGLLHGHVQHFVDIPALVADVEGFAIVALAFAQIAGHVDVREKVHFHLDDAVAAACLAATTAHIEAEPPGAVTAGARFGGCGEKLPHRREQTRVGGRIGSGRSPDGTLVYVDDLVQMMQTLDAIVRGRISVCVVELAGGDPVKSIVDQCRLA